jgi:hypothetical protein
MAKLSNGQFSGLVSQLNMGAPKGKGGGFTVDAKTLKPVETGTMVSAPTDERQVPQSQVSSGALRDYHSSTDFSAPYNNFGGWNPGGREDVSLDKSRRVMPDQGVQQQYGEKVAQADAMTSALDLGIMNQQEAVFRLDDFTEAPTGIKREDINRGPAGGGALRPERLTGPQMDSISPGWTARAYERAQRSDGGNG